MILSNVGQYYDGTQFTINLGSNAKIGSLLSLGLTYEYDQIRFPTRSQSFKGHIGGFNALVMINNKLSISSRVQYSNIAHGVGTNLRLRFNPKEGNDFYIVYNEGRNIDLYRESPTLNPIANRSILLKYTYTFTL